MNALIVLSLVALGSNVLAEADEDLYDLVDIKKILDDDEKTLLAFNCLMDLGPCGPYQLLRDKLPHLLHTGCRHCTPEHKAKYASYMDIFYRKNSAAYNMMVAKYPEQV